MDFRPDLSWEFLSSDEIEAKSVRAVRNHVRHIKEISPYYRARLEPVNPEDVTSLEDISSLPITPRDDLASQSSQFVGTDYQNITETVLTTGTTGKALPFLYTCNDLDRITFSTALSFHGIGITASDRVLILLSLDRCSFDGMAQYRGAIMAGANTLRLGAGVTLPSVLQQYMKFFKPTVLIGLPSQLQTLAAELKKNGYDTAKSPVTKIVAVGESVFTADLAQNAVGKALHEQWGALPFSLYSTTELAVHFGECSEHKGLHAHPELVYTEIVDDDGNPLPDGEIGELVATPLGVEGVPLLRYRTGDMTFKVKGECSCGRNSIRIGPILGHRSQLFKYNGAVIYPLSLTNALDGVEEVKDYLVILENDNKQSDSVTIHVAAPPAALEKISQAIKAATGVFIPSLVSNIPTIQSLRGGVKKKISILDQRGKTVAVGV